jgi:hypothetical protein
MDDRKMFGYADKIDIESDKNNFLLRNSIIYSRKRNKFENNERDMQTVSCTYI